MDKQGEIPRRIGTHNGGFHADEIMGIAILLMVFPNTPVIRSRNPQHLEACDVLVDIGGGRYDHHHRENKETRNNGVPYASAGLVWRDYAERYISMVIENPERFDLKQIAQEVDWLLFEGIDAIDNGMVVPGVYVLRDTDLDVRVDPMSSVFLSLNGHVDFDDMSDAAQKPRFDKAIELAQALLRKAVLERASDQLWAQRVADADTNQPILLLSSPCLDTPSPWKSEVLRRKHIKFVVYPDSQGGRWHLKAAPIKQTGFETRALLPLRLAALMDGELEDESGISGAIFVHRRLTFAATRTKEAAIQLAQLALREEDESQDEVFDS